MTRQRALHDPFYDDETMRGGFFAGLGELIAAYPSIAGGSAAFAVIFGFVSSNALWYQPGKHPAPIMQTRSLQTTQTGQSDSESPIRQAVQTQSATGNPATSEVSTFRIERDENPPTGSIPVPVARPELGNGDTEPQTVAALPDAVPQVVNQAVNDAPAADPLLEDIQALLKRKGFYGGDVDGLIGPMSEAAIRNWQKRAGLNMTGQPTQEVLDSLRIGGRPQSIAPRNQPRVTEAVAVSQPVAAPVAPVMRDVIAEAIAPQGANPAPVDPVAQLSGASELVRQIQSGLANIAYADIAIDGVAGLQTKDAISAFEKHYRLPVTGEPNKQVLQKLVEIGAL